MGFGSALGHDRLQQAANRRAIGDVSPWREVRMPAPSTSRTVSAKARLADIDKCEMAVAPCERLRDRACDATPAPVITAVRL